MLHQLALKLGLFVSVGRLSGMLFFGLKFCLLFLMISPVALADPFCVVCDRILLPFLDSEV